MITTVRIDNICLDCGEFAVHGYVEDGILKLTSIRQYNLNMSWLDAGYFQLQHPIVLRAVVDAIDTSEFVGVELAGNVNPNYPLAN